MKNPDLPQAAADAAGLVEYQSGSIVSRTLFKASTGSVTVFAFDEGQELSEHTVPFHALVHVVNGEALITVSGRTSPVREGQVIVMPANEPHAVKATARFKMILSMVKV